MPLDFVSRSESGLRKPRSVSRNVAPEDGGVAVHYGGNGAAPITHKGCLSLWRGWQAYHMDDRNWTDIAYNFGFCNHGSVFAGRGYGVRSAAQGSNDGNDRFLAAVFLGGAATSPSPEAVNALRWIVFECRRLGAGREVRPHQVFNSTSCPGNPLTRAAASMHNRVFSDPYKLAPVTPKPAPPVVVPSRDDWTNPDMWLANVAGPDQRVFLITSVGKVHLTPAAYAALSEAREKGIIREAEVGSAFLNLLPTITLPNDLVELMALSPITPPPPEAPVTRS